MKKKKYDFSGWATRANIKCSDGRTIMPNAFKDQDGQQVPLLYMHVHDDPTDILGHAVLENRDGDMYAYCSFNDSPKAQAAKTAVEHGDVDSLSIWANKLVHNAGNVMHGVIKEVSLVLAGANAGAKIEYPVLQHSDGSFSEEPVEDEARIYFNQPLEFISHADDEDDEDDDDTDEKGNGAKSQNGPIDVKKVMATLTPLQHEAVKIYLGIAIEHADEIKKKAGGGSEKPSGEEVKHSDMRGTEMNVFDQTAIRNNQPHISHSDWRDIIADSKETGSFKKSFRAYLASRDDSAELMHGLMESPDIDQLFPEYELYKKGRPDYIKEKDMGWITKFMNGVHKTPFARVRTRFADNSDPLLRAKGYIKGDKKTIGGNLKLITRTTDPTTVYRKDVLERDDILDITEYNIVDWLYEVMKENLNETLAVAMVLGDPREEGDRERIDPTKIRPIYGDDPLFVIYRDIDTAAMAAELQGTDTTKYFGTSFIEAEAIITALRFAREDFHGTGTPTMWITPHELNVLLLARDRDGHRVFTSKNDLTAALDVKEIVTCEHFANQFRTDADNHKHQLLALVFNPDDYNIGTNKGGAITKFTDFDIDYNQEKYLIETRLSAALVKPYSVIALEKPAA